LCRSITGLTMALMTFGRSVVIMTVVILATSACDRYAGHPEARVVAEVGGQPVTVAQLLAYLDANQFQETGAEPLPPGDLARVKSRLFDDFLDGELLYQEARRRGITVSDAELAEYLGQQFETAPSARELARHDLTIQKLRESVVLAEVRVNDREIDDWLAARAPTDEPALSGKLLTLRLASYPEAVRVRKEILSKKLSFAEAEAAYGADSIPDTPRDQELEALPPQIAAAIRQLQPGSVSAPLPFETSVLLFLLESAENPSDAESRRREGARNAIALEKSQTEADKLLRDLRAKNIVTRHLEALPFLYVAEGAEGHAQ
jgi:parvulin-like peptidyl-prolyl isomerase